MTFVPVHFTPLPPPVPGPELHASVFVLTIIPDPVSTFDDAAGMRQIFVGCQVNWDKYAYLSEKKSVFHHCTLNV